MKYREFKAAVQYLTERNGEVPTFGVLIDFISKMS